MAYNADIERLNYYEGEYLGAVDFQAEQEYFLEMRRRHNLGQHTWGIVTGLELAQTPNGGTDGSRAEMDVYLQPGLAVDGFGREIVVLSQMQLTEEMFAAFYNPSNNASPIWVYVWISYQEALLNPPADACNTANGSNEFGRIQETYTLTATVAGAPPVNGSIVVDGIQTTPPSAPSSSSGSGTTSATTDPPAITLPYDDSIPFQEFPTDDSTLIWWIPLGRLMWDPHNEVFVQISTDAAKAAASSAANREYAGNVSATTYAPAGMYTIVDRNSPYPPVAGTDPNLGGVSAEVAGSLQVDFLLNAQMNALIGDAYNTNEASPLSPLTIVAPQSGVDPDQSLIQFRDPTQTETWYINQLFDGSTPGLNFGEFTAAGNKVDNRIFIQPTQTSSSAPSAQNVGIGTSRPRNPLAVRGQGKWWELLSFEDNTGTTKWHVNHNPQGSSPSGVAYTPGVNFSETGVSDFRLFLQTGGNVGVGTGAPAATLDINGSLRVGGATTLSPDSPGTYLGWNLSGGTNETDIVNNSGTGSGGFAFINTPSAGTPQNTLVTIKGSGDVGVGTTSPQQNLSVNSGLNIDQENQNPGGSLAGGANNMLTFGSASGEGVGSCRIGGNPNTYGLDFYTDFEPRMSIEQHGNVGVGTQAPEQTLSINAGLNIDQANQNPGGPLLGGANKMLTFGSGSGEGIGSCRIIGNTNTYGLDFYTDWNPRISIAQGGDVTITGTVSIGGALHVSGPITSPNKTGCVEDRFINRDGIVLERGDVVVLHPTPSSQFYGSVGQIPLVEIRHADSSHDPAVCGIVDEPALPDAKMPDLDRQKLGSVDVGLMVTLGAYAFCKVDADVAPISPGDRLTTSHTPGYAQKLNPLEPARPGIVIGKAMGSLQSGKGTIPIFVTHQ